MSFLKYILVLLVAVGGLTGCDNNSLEIPDLRLSALQNTDDKIANTYQFRSKQLYLFTSVNSSKTGAGTTTRKFITSGGFLDRIISDSTQLTYSLTEIYYNGTVIAEDSTFLFTKDATTKITTRSKTGYRKFAFDGNGDLVNVLIRTWSGATVTETEYVLERTDRNVTKFSKYNVNGESKVLAQTLTIQYDQRPNMYASSFPYFYTLSADELYWLSVNNPITIQESNKKDLTFQYSYNRFNHPSLFKNGSGKQFGASYINNK